MTKYPHEGPDRRKYVRVDIYTVTRYLCPYRHEEAGVQARISDISEGGALLITFSEGIPLELEVKMDFWLPGLEKGKPVSVMGKVRHTEFLGKDLYRTGIEFLSVTKQSKQILRDFIVMAETAKIKKH